MNLQQLSGSARVYFRRFSPSPWMPSDSSLMFNGSVWICQSLISSSPVHSRTARRARRASYSIRRTFFMSWRLNCPREESFSILVFTTNLERITFWILQVMKPIGMLCLLNYLNSWVAPKDLHKLSINRKDQGHAGVVHIHFCCILLCFLQHHINQPFINCSSTFQGISATCSSVSSASTSRPNQLRTWDRTPLHLRCRFETE